MKRLKGTPAEGRVSYADLIALGGAYAVALTGGPAIDVPIGAPLTLNPETLRNPECRLAVPGVAADPCLARNAGAPAHRARFMCA